MSSKQRAFAKMFLMMINYPRSFLRYRFPYLLYLSRVGGLPSVFLAGRGGCFSFGGTVQYIEESNIYLCFVVCRLKRGLVT